MCVATEYKAARPVSLLHLLHLKLPNDSSAVSGTTSQRQPLIWEHACQPSHRCPSKCSRFSKISRRNRGLNDLSIDQSNAVNACFGTRRNRLREPHSDKMRRSAIIERERRRESAFDQSQQCWPPLLLAIVMWAARPAHESEAIIESTIGHTERICQAVLKPADRACTDARHHNPRIPSRSQRSIESMQAPHSQQIRTAAPAHIDNVVVHYERFKVGNFPLKESEMGCGGTRWGKSFMEAPDIRIAVAGRRSHEAYAWPPLAARKAQYEIIEQQIVRLHRKSTAAQRHDVSCRRWPALAHLYYRGFHSRPGTAVGSAIDAAS